MGPAGRHWFSLTLSRLGMSYEFCRPLLPGRRSLPNRRRRIPGSAAAAEPFASWCYTPQGRERNPTVIPPHYDWMQSVRGDGERDAARLCDDAPHQTLSTVSVARDARRFGIRYGLLKPNRDIYPPRHGHPPRVTARYGLSGAQKLAFLGWTNSGDCPTPCAPAVVYPELILRCFWWRGCP